MRSFIRDVGTAGIYNELEETMAGQIVFCASTSIPNGYLECNGASVSRTTYATLFAAIGGTYGPGDGATTFNLPDLRGEFIRGADRGRGVDSGRAVGSGQTDSIKDHAHSLGPTRTFQAGGSFPWVVDGTGLSATEDRHAPMVNPGTETRPRNVAMIAVIKY